MNKDESAVAYDFTRSDTPSGQAGAEGLMRLSPDAVLVVDSAGRLLDANNEANALFGTELSVGTDFGVPSSDPEGWSVLHIMGHEGPVQMQAKTRQVRWSGAEAHVIALRPVPDAPTETTRTEHPDVAGVRHDLDNALTVARGYASTLAAHWTELPEEMRATFLGRIVANLDAVADFSSDLVETSLGMRPPLSEPVPLHALISEAVAAAPTNVEVSVHMERKDGELLAVVDPVHARRVLRNLIGNAARHGAPPLELRGHDVGDDEHIEILVTDAGNGISEDVAATLFDRGISGGGSTGLGLHVARQLAEANGGTLTVDPPAEDRGAQFRLRLVRRPAPEA